ncbi:MAG: putative zinc-binding metallopeptidase [Candidatus Gracilibacteria bacterium]|nr:putative zinc-binding metallopeptidase [Candidatus Gracilibacteria bacterium]
MKIDFKKDFFKICILTLVFSFLIFIAKNYFFGGKNDFENSVIEEKYISPISLNQDSDNFNLEELDKKVEEKIISNLASAAKFKYNFIPENLFSESDFKPYIDSIDTFLNSKIIEPKISFLELFLNKQKGEVRGKMKNKSLYIFGIYDMSVGESLAVTIHEFGHFLDLYILEKKVSLDLSDSFYDISWLSTTTLKPSMQQSDFVSGYAMTNKYEDFAETFIYYVLHNSDFYEKSQSSEFLKKKYDFFSNYIFRNDEFKTNNYSTITDIKDYYRDITKIEYSLQNFLQYLKK